MGKPKVSVIIVNYNGKPFLADCIASIGNHIPVPHEIIIVDNASSDGSCEFIKEKFPAVKLMCSEENNGFAKGNNMGADIAESEYLLLLNNDAFLRDDITPGLNLLEQKDIGIVGARMYGRDGEYRYSCGYFPSPSKMFILSSRQKKDGPFLNGDFTDSDQPYYQVDWIEGSFLLVTARLWNELGGLDEDYFMYGEDVDFARRARLKGYKTVYCPNVSYTHIGGYNDSRMSLLAKGFRRHMKKFLSPTDRLLGNLVLDAGMFLRVLVNAPKALAGDGQKKTKALSCLRALFRMS